MVTGIDSFREWFKGSEEQYAIIGGTACDILMTEEGLDFRATKDIDLVLIIEAVDANAQLHMLWVNRVKKASRATAGLTTDPMSIAMPIPPTFEATLSSFGRGRDLDALAC